VIGFAQATFPANFPRGTIFPLATRTAAPGAPENRENMISRPNGFLFLAFFFLLSSFVVLNHASHRIFSQIAAGPTKCSRIRRRANLVSLE